MAIAAYGEIVVGDGEHDVLFLPGAGLAALEGASVAEALSPVARTRLLDLPGSGSAAIAGTPTWRAIADWACAYLDARSLSSVAVVGHSLGGMCALALADVHPERVRRLVLLDAGHRDIPRLPVTEFGLAAALTPLASALVAVFGPGVLRPLLPAARPPRSPAETQARARAWARAIGAEAALDRVRATLDRPVPFGPEAAAVALAMYRTRLPRRLWAVRVPTLLVYAAWPGRPRLARQAEAAVATLRARRPDIAVLRVEGGHYVHWVDPNRVHRAIVDFVTGS